MQCHEVDYELIGDDMQIVEVELDPGETVIAEAGAVNYMEDGISYEARTGDGSRADEGIMGKLLNQRFLPSVLDGEGGIDNFAHLIRTYFKLNGHHVQFNVVDTSTLRKAQATPDEYRDLLVRVAGYSDYFVDLDRDHQEEIIASALSQKSSP